MNVKVCDINEITIKSGYDNYEISRLAASIKKNGLLEPIYLRRDIKNPKKYIIIDGKKRFAAIKFLEIKNFPAILFSLTDTEADIMLLVINQTKNSMSIFDESFYIGRIIKSGRITKSELSSALGITIKKLEEKIKILDITEDEKEVILNHSFDEDLINEFLTFNKDERQKILSHIVVKSLSNEESKKYMYQLKNPEIKPIKAATITDDKIILNSIERMSSSLNENGINSSCRRTDYEDKTEYTLTIKKEQITVPKN